MRIQLAALAVLLTVLAATAPARAQEALDALPDETAIVVRIDSIDALREGLDAVFAAAGPRAQNPQLPTEDMLGEALEVEGDLDAIRSDAPVYIAVFPVEEPQPVAYLVQADDEQRLQRAVLRLDRGQEAEIEQREGGFVVARNASRVWYFGTRGDWIVYTPSEAVADIFAASEDGGFEIDDPRAAELFDGGLVSAVANVALITDTFASELREGRRRTIEQIEAMPADQLSQAGLSGEGVIEIYREIITWMFDALTELRWAALQLQLDDDRVALEGVVTVDEGGELDRLLADNPPSRIELLESLPAGAPAYFATDINMELVIPWARDLMTRMFGDNEAVQDLLDSFDAFEGIGQIAGSFAPPPDRDTGLVVLELMADDDPQAVLEAYRAYFDAMLALQAEAIGEQTAMQYEPDAEEYGGHSIDVAVQPPIEGAPPNPVLPADGLEFRFAALDEALAMASGNDPEIMEGLIDAAEGEGDTLADDAAFAAVREQLGDEANVIIVADPQQLFVVFMQMAAGGAPLAGGPQGEGNYAGISLSTEPQGVRVRATIPTAVIGLLMPTGPGQVVPQRAPAF